MHRPQRTSFSTLFLLLSLALMAAAPVFGGVYYEAVTTVDDGKGSSTVHAWLDGDNAHLEFVESDVPYVSKGNYLLSTDGGETFFLVNPKEQTYMRWDMAAVMGMLEGMSAMVSFEILDPTVTKIDEKAGESMLGHETRYVRYKSTYEMKMKVLGMKRASRIESDQEMWLTDDFAVETLHAWIKGFRSSGSKDMDQLLGQEMEKLDGFPLKTATVTVTTDKKGRSTRSRSVTEVKEVREDSPSADLFQIPAGYKETQLVPQGEDGESNPLKGIFGGRKN